MKLRNHKPVLRMTQRITVKEKLRYIVTGGSIAALTTASVMYIYMMQTKEVKAKSSQPTEKAVHYNLK